MVFSSAGVVTATTEIFTRSNSYNLDIRSMVSFIPLNLVLAMGFFTPNFNNFIRNFYLYDKSNETKLLFSMIFSNEWVISSIFPMFHAKTEKLSAVANAALATRNEFLKFSMESAWNTMNAIDELTKVRMGNKTRNVLKWSVSFFFEWDEWIPIRWYVVRAHRNRCIACIRRLCTFKGLLETGRHIDWEL